ncbi:hypothetical protein QJS10_CPB11g01546 [Acorus calamus]|uniref:DUF4283 domain-containing protein n=1 Tax=Acorus calamus TaxID=4465 RepID=A0AAV9DRH2_ACOCL|nr:hypothetical protein QJS10_CPB11g01546 [Acorus calamus]
MVMNLLLFSNLKFIPPSSNIGRMPWLATSSVNLQCIHPLFPSSRSYGNQKESFSSYFMAMAFLRSNLTLPRIVNATLEGGPWTMEHRPLILKRWSPDIRMEQERLSSIPIWVRLPNLPLHLWNVDCLSRIGSLIGSPLFMDSATLRCTKTSFARLCIEVEASTVLPDEVSVEIAPGLKEKFKVDYDWRPSACIHCQTFGHNEVRCCKKPLPASEKETHVLPSVDKGKDIVVSSSTTQFQPPKKIAKKLLSDAQKANTSSQQGRFSSSKQGSIPHFNKFLPLQETACALPLTNCSGETESAQPTQCHIAKVLAVPLASDSNGLVVLVNKSVKADDGGASHTIPTTAVLTYQHPPSSTQHLSDGPILSHECIEDAISNTPMLKESQCNPSKGIDLAIYLPISEMHMAKQSLSSNEDSRGKPKENKKKQKAAVKSKQQAFLSATSATSVKWMKAGAPLSSKQGRQHH